MKTLEIVYQEDKTALIYQTSTVLERMRGLLGRELEQFAGLWIIPCNSIHTLAMRYPLDLVYLNKDAKIIKLVENIPPWKFSACFAAHSVIELKVGLIQEFAFKEGDIVRSKSV